MSIRITQTEFVVPQRDDYGQPIGDYLDVAIATTILHDTVIISLENRTETGIQSAFDDIDLVLTHDEALALAESLVAIVQSDRR